MLGAVGLVVLLLNGGLATTWAEETTAAETAEESQQSLPGEGRNLLLATFDERRAWTLDEVWAYYQGATKGPPAGFNIAAALFVMGKVEEARKVAHRSLDTIEPGNKINRWMYGGNSGFTAWPGIDCYIRHQGQMDDALRARFKAIYTGAVFYPRLTTSNHKIMAAVTRYLATQEWGESAFVMDPRFTPDHTSGTIFAKDDPTGEKYVRRIIASTIKDGPGEYASRPYGAENILPLLTLSECAKDPTVRSQARFAYEMSLIQLASVYLHGHLGTFSTRSYPDAMNQSPWGVAAVPWVYYGGVVPGGMARQWALRSAIADYRLPKYLQAIGDDRKQSYTHRAGVNGWALTHFVTKNYVLFSRSPKVGNPVTLGQSYACGVMWDEPDLSRGSHLWITNPAADSSEAGSRNNPTGIHTHGITRMDRQVQRENASLTVYNIEPTFRNPYVLAYIPGGYRAFINDSAHGRVFLHYGSVLIAIASSTPFTWDPQAGIRAPATKPALGDSEFRIQATQVAVGLETALPEEFPGASPAIQLSNFQIAMMAKSSIKVALGADVVGQYRDRNGNRLQCAYAGDDLVNDQQIDYGQWPSQENPWVKQPRNGNLTITNGKDHVVYDVATLTMVPPNSEPLSH